jgi:hypothetical protein
VLQRDIDGGWEGEEDLVGTLGLTGFFGVLGHSR